MSGVAAKKVAVLMLVEIIPMDGFDVADLLVAEKDIQVAIAEAVDNASEGRPWYLHRVVQAVAP